jgi:hypothetical protein
MPKRSFFKVEASDSFGGSIETPLHYLHPNNVSQNLVIAFMPFTAALPIWSNS